MNQDIFYLVAFYAQIFLYIGIWTKIPQQVYNNHKRNNTVADHDSRELFL